MAHGIASTVLFRGVAIPFDVPTFSSSQKTTFASASLASLAPSYFGNGGPSLPPYDFEVTERRGVCGTEGELN